MAQFPSVRVVDEAITLDEYGGLVSGGSWQPALDQAAADAAASVGGTTGGRIHIPKGLRSYRYLPLYQDVEWFGEGRASMMMQVNGAAEPLAKNVSGGAILRPKIRDMTLTAFQNQAANTGGLDLFRVAEGLYSEVQLSFFQNWGARCKGGADPNTGDAMRNTFRDMRVNDGQPGSCICRLSSGSDQPGATSGGGHADGTRWEGGLGQSMPIGFVVDPPPDGGVNTFAADRLYVDMDLQEVPIVFDILGGWSHRLGGRWENVAGVTIFSAGRAGTGNITNLSNVITNVALTGASLPFAVGQPITGVGIPADTYIIGVNLDGANTLRLSANATATTVGVALTSVGTVANPIRNIGLSREMVPLQHGNLVSVVDPNSAIFGEWYDGQSKQHTVVPDGLQFKRLTAPYDNDSLWRDTGDKLRWYDHAGGLNVVLMSKMSTLITAAVYAQAGSDRILRFDPGANPITVNLQPAANQNGMQLTFKRVTGGANALTIDPNGAETIDGAATLLLPNQWDRATIVSDGANWFRID